MCMRLVRCYREFAVHGGGAGDIARIGDRRWDEDDVIDPAAVVLGRDGDAPKVAKAQIARLSGVAYQLRSLG